ncbi:MAG: hypothetical protein ACOCZD_01390 [Haloferacaceae archaeon]
MRSAVHDHGPVEFAIVVAVGFPTVVGPLIEVVVPLTVVTVALYYRRRYDWAVRGDGSSTVADPTTHSHQ